ncbi:MAG TPA: metallophosphoesterase family protein, partial [Mucilaginibacter sp.]
MYFNSQKQNSKSIQPFISILTLSVLSALTLLQPKTACSQSSKQKSDGAIIEMVFTSDAHYAITRKGFRGDSNVNSHIVNTAMISQMNNLSKLKLPADSGVDAGNGINHIDYVIEGGDIANRMEKPFQSAAASWAQFETDYLKGIKLKDGQGKPVKFLIVPGNHDISNA